ncbi:MAG: hypothetical protein HKN32_06345 [Flavobacteriales bacterium]|nr:hypothetical protein [Flavobacteriales bacterium]
MKTTNLRFLAFFVATTALLSSCGGLGKMEKYIEELNAKAEPEPLIVRGDSIEVNITGKFPDKYFHKKVIVEATPVLTYDGGETAFEMKGFQGEDAAGNYEVIPYEGGKSFSYTDVIAYEDGMQVSELELRIQGSKGSKSEVFEPLVVGSGVITTPYLMQDDDRPIMSSDDFQRVLSMTKNATINYAYNSSNVRSGELRQDDIKAMNAFIAEAAEADSLVLKGTQVDAYASPEGEISLNENLAQERAESANAVIAKQIKREKIEVENPEAFYTNNPKGEDWEGFKDLMQESSIEDKNLILRVLEMYTDVQKREQEIKNISKTYREIEKEILPALRRSQITLNYDVEGYTDEELKVLVMSNPEMLTVEEILFSATLFDGLNDKLNIYESAERLYPEDYRGVNNVGYVLFLQAKKDEAASQFEKAWNIEQAPEVANNMGIAARLNGDRDGALDFFEQSASAGSDVNYNKGLVLIQKGEYTSAVNNMGSNNTMNTGLAKLLNGDVSGAQAAIDNSGDNSAMADYFRAVVAARQNDSQGVLTNIQKAVAADSTLADKAKKDMEFRDYWAQFSF